jgi:hypothetical protein
VSLRSNFVLALQSSISCVDVKAPVALLGMAGEARCPWFCKGGGRAEGARGMLDCWGRACADVSALWALLRLAEQPPILCWIANDGAIGDGVRCLGCL